jgi:hypothetical protein
MWKAYFMGLTTDWKEEKVCPHKCGKKRNYCQYERKPILEDFQKRRKNRNGARFSRVLNHSNFKTCQPENKMPASAIKFRGSKLFSSEQYKMISPADVKSS